MTEDVEILYDYLKSCQISIQLDESILQCNDALHITHVRFIKQEKKSKNFLKIRKRDTKAESTFNIMNKFFNGKTLLFVFGMMLLTMLQQ